MLSLMSHLHSSLHQMHLHGLSNLLSKLVLFAFNPGELGTTQMVTHTINTGEHAPIRQPVRRTPFALRAKVEEMVTEMLD